MRSRCRPALLLVFLLLPGLVPSRALGEGARPFSEVEKAFKEAFKAEDPGARMRAFDVVAACPDPRCVDLVVGALDDIRAQQPSIRKLQEQEEARYEAQLTKYEKLNAWYLSTSKTGRDLDRYNKAERKISRQRDAALLELKRLENEFARTRSQIDGGVIAVGRILASLHPAALPAALTAVETAWLRGRDLDGPLRWIDAVSPVHLPPVDERLRNVVGDETTSYVITSGWGEPAVPRSSLWVEARPQGTLCFGAEGVGAQPPRASDSIRPANFQRVE